MGAFHSANTSESLEDRVEGRRVHQTSFVCHRESDSEEGEDAHLEPGWAPNGTRQAPPKEGTLDGEDQGLGSNPNQGFWGSEDGHASSNEENRPPLVQGLGSAADPNSIGFGPAQNGSTQNGSNQNGSTLTPPKRLRHSNSMEFGKLRCAFGTT